MNTKHRIVLRSRKSKFVDIFRTTPPKTVCPNFFVLAHANGCAFAPHCSYCYLKSSFSHLQGQHVFTNVDKLLREVKAWIRKDRLESYVLNTGNLSDSLGFEEQRPLMPKLIELFRNEAEAKGRPHALLFVTKGGVRGCQVLLDVKPCANVIVSFSVNNPEAARLYEAGAASTADRLAAARKLRKAGWRLRMRIDPMILGFDYAAIARAVRALKPERVTLGTLRAEPNLDRYVGEGLFDKLERPADPKSLSRYPIKTRLAMYRKAIRHLGGACPVALCEETYDVWNALGLDTEAKQCNCGG